MTNTNRLLLSAVSVSTLMIAAPQAMAQDASTGAVAPSSEIVVTGTRVAGRTKLDTISPVDVINSQTLQRNGTTELSQALSEALPSLNFPRPTLTDGTDSVRPVTLRGMAPDQVLVLVDGKRRESSALVNLNGTVGRGSASVDLNTIPTAALSTVEVLRDGASAQYGSDAIAGVVNLRLREANHGGGVSITSGFYDTSVNTTPQPAPAGATWSSPSSRNVRDGFVTTASGWVGLPIGDAGFLTLTAETKDQAHTTRAGPDLRPQYALVGGAYDPRENGIDRIGNWYGDPNLDQYTLFANAGYDANDVHYYGWASYQHRDTVSGGTFRRPCSATTSCANTLTSTSANSSLQDIASIYPDGFLPKIAPTIEDLSGAVGAKFKLAGWDWDASVVYGDNKIHYHVIDSLNVTLGPNSQTDFDAGSLDYSQTVADLSAVRQFPTRFTAEPINVAAGLEYRYEEYQITPGEQASYINSPVFTGIGAVPAGAGAQVFPGFAPSNATDATRNSYAGYVDVDVKPLHQLDIDGAVRGEHYDGFGGVVTGKLAARYDFNPMFALRGAISNGFRAPSLQQTAFTSTTTTFINTATPFGNQALPYQIITAPAGSALVQPLGSQPLKPEKSDNYSVGGVLRLHGLNVTVDAYEIKVHNRIVLSENLTQASVVALLPAGDGGVRFFTNGVETDTKGVEAVATYRWIPGFADIGRFDLTASEAHNSTDVTRVPSVTAGVAVPVPLFARINTLILEEGQPKDKAVLSSDWQKGSFGATVRATYYGNVTVPGSTAALDYNLGSHTLVDLELRANFGPHATIALGIDNIFDSYPNPTPNSSGGAFSSYSPFGFDGRFLYARASYTW